MTVIVRVLCKNGVVIGSDSSATFGCGTFRTIEQPFEQKIQVIDRHVIVASTGQIGLAQRFTEVIRGTWEKKEFKGSAVEVGKHLARKALEDFQFTGIQQPNYGSLVAFPLGGKPYLCEFQEGSFQPELKSENLWYVAMGSGQTIADPFLALMRQIFWHDGVPSCQDAIFAISWTLDHAIRVNPGGINGPIHIVMLTFDNKRQAEARRLEAAEIEEHLENVQGAITHLRLYPSTLQGETDAPDIPRLPT